MDDYLRFPSAERAAMDQEVYTALGLSAHLADASEDDPGHWRLALLLDGSLAVRLAGEPGRAEDSGRQWDPPATWAFRTEQGLTLLYALDRRGAGGHIEDVPVTIGTGGEGLLADVLYGWSHGIFLPPLPGEPVEVTAWFDGRSPVDIALAPAPDGLTALLDRAP